jgi:esterase/lipase superfamily enzyme
VNVEFHHWHSPALDRDMPLLVFGHAGARVLVFPTSLGSHREWADRGMHEVLGDHLRQGWIQLFCVDHVHGESWYGEHLHPGARAWRHPVTLLPRPPTAHPPLTPPLTSGYLVSLFRFVPVSSLLPQQRS